MGWGHIKAEELEDKHTCAPQLINVNHESLVFNFISMHFRFHFHHSWSCRFPGTCNAFLARYYTFYRYTCTCQLRPVGDIPWPYLWLQHATHYLMCVCKSKQKGCGLRGFI